MEIVLMNDDAIIPTRASKRSAGLDLYSNIDVDIDINSIKKVNTAIRVSLPENTYGSIKDKSSLAAKGILTLGGVIDNDYTGEIIVIMTSLIKPIKLLTNIGGYITAVWGIEPYNLSSSVFITAEIFTFSELLKLDFMVKSTVEKGVVK